MLVDVIEFQLSYFKFWKITQLKCCTQHARKSEKLSSGHRTGKGQFSFQSPRRAISKNVLMILQLLIWHASKVMFKFLQTRLHQYMNWELPDIQAGFWKGRRTSDQIGNICWILEKARQFQKKSASATLTKLMPLTVNLNKLWRILKEIRVPHQLTCPLRNLHVN